MKTLVPTLATMQCHHCNADVADRPPPAVDDLQGWSAEAIEHRLGCAFVLSKGGQQACPVAPLFARGKQYFYGDPMWRNDPTRSY